MEFSLILTQLIIIFLLIGIGALLYKLHIVNEDGARQLSGIVVNVTNPAVMILSAVSDEKKEPLADLGFAFLCFTIVYFALLGIAYVLPLILHIKKDDRYSYRMLTMFGNVGFVGIPLASALLGSRSLIYISACNLCFNLFIYTYGYADVEKAAKRQHQANAQETAEELPAKKKKPAFLKVLNMGTVSSIITVILYCFNISLPSVVYETINYCGRCTVMLSMLVLGITVAQMVPKELFADWKLYLFTLLRQILIPIAIVLIFKNFVKSDLLLAVIAIEFSVPAANTPLMFSKQLRADETTIAHGILMTTLLSILTIPIVFLFL